MLIYFAGPLFSEAEKRFNLRLSERLEEAGFRVFLPQRDGVEGSKPPYDRMNREERRRAMFELDKQRVFESDVFLLVLDGRVPDEGACVELGLAHAHRALTGSDKLIVGLHTDERSAFVGFGVSLLRRTKRHDEVRPKPSMIHFVLCVHFPGD